MSISPVDWLMQQSHKHPLLTPEQEIIYSRHIQQWLQIRDKPNPTPQDRATIRRGKRAYDRFFLSNIRLVVKIAGRYSRFVGTLGLDDMMQEGLLGLERAIVKFDATRGYKFSTYAFNWIRQSISRSLSNKSRTIRLPANAITVLKRALDYMKEHDQQFGRMPTMQRIAEHCNVEPQTLRGYLAHGAPMVSLDDRAKNDGRTDSCTLIELIADESNTNDLDEYSTMVPLLETQLAKLSQTDRRILEQLYMVDHGRRSSLNAMAKELGISRQAVSLRHQKALRQLRMQFNRAEPAHIPELQCAA